VSFEGASGSDILLDTSILIDYYRKKKLQNLVGMNLSTITLLEFLRYYERPEERSRAKSLLESLFNVVPIDNDVVLEYCRIYREVQKQRLDVGDADLLIAATAIAKGLKLKIKNRKHFKPITKLGLELSDDDGN